MTTQIELSRQARVNGDVSWSSNKITNLATPTNPSDAANKSYVDNAILGLNWHKACRVASTGSNVSISSAPSTLDGITLTSGDRILLKDQTTGSQNGIYAFAGSGSAMAYDTDFVQGDVVSGMAFFVTAGTVNSGTGWVLTTANPITVSTTSLTFAQFTSATESTVLAGNGLQASGAQLVVLANGSTLNVSSSGVKVATGGITNNGTIQQIL